MMARHHYLYGGAATAALSLLVAACQNLGARDTADADAEPLSDRVSYNWHVRPILSQNCFACHGNDGAKREAGLRLDLAEAAYGKLPENPDGRAIVRGNPDRSELIRRITSSDPELRMPPRETHKVLSQRDVAILKKWIKQGAGYEEHWAYIQPRRVKPQRTRWDKRAVNEIDRYVYAALADKGLSPSQEAHRETLINRVTLDLTGLPPTLPEVDAFVADKSPKAYEKVVDRLLASRAYAERQAATWLDVARYADTDGFLNDQYGRFQFPYRDWVISAFQRNIPYDRFVTWQLAGDLLPNATREQILATAFARAGKKSNEAGIIDEEYRVEYVNERSELVGKAFLGLTVGCAKCHDHKYDVISQADYYSLSGFFNSIDESGIHSGTRGTPMGPTLPWPTPSQAAALEKAKAVTAARRNALGQALATARSAAAPRAAELAPAPAGLKALAALVEESQQAYYPFDKAAPGPVDSLQIVRRTTLRRPDGSADTTARRNSGVVRVSNPEPKSADPPPARRRGGGGAKAPDAPRDAADEIDRAVTKAIAEGRPDEGARAIPKPGELLVGLDPRRILWSPSAKPAVGAAAFSNVQITDGPRGLGKAVLLNDSVVMAAPDVGQFERNQPFSLDLWVKLPANGRYEDGVAVLQNSDGRGPGYALKLEDNRLSFNLQHLQPYNMLSIRTLAPLPTGRWVHVSATYDGSSAAAGVKLYLDGRAAKTETVRDRLTRTARPRGGSLYPFSSYYGLFAGKQFQQVELKGGALDELRVFTRALTPAEVAYLHDPAGARGRADLQESLATAQAEKDPRVQATRAALQQAQAAEQAIEAGVAQVMVLADAPKPRPTYLLERGLYNQLGKPVPVQAPSRVFAWNEKLPRNRLGLAQWLFDRKNPLTARVYVNRLWHGHFGLGLVETVEDFGTQGSNPSNPELLDWLALEFQRSGWDVRHMHKLVVMSATYRQSSALTPELREKDARNLYLGRGPRFRLPAETIRDNALFASGLLVDRPGGDSVFPFQPDGVFDATGTGMTVYPKPTDVPADQHHRRSMYTFYKRNAPPPSLAVFDMADRNVSTVQRSISNTPLQALVLLNDPQYREAYRKLAERALRTTPNGDRALVTMFRLATRRHPGQGELARLRAFRAAQVQRLSTRPEEVDQLLAIGVVPVDARVERVQLAALTLATAAVMNSPDAYTLR